MAVVLRRLEEWFDLGYRRIEEGPRTVLEGVIGLGWFVLVALTVAYLVTRCA